MTRLFGTDGIRGRAGEAPLDRETVVRVGRARARRVGRAGPARILLGRDTRASGPTMEGWLATGIAAGGGRLVRAGVLPTPAIAALTRRGGFDAGVVVSASHNPWEDNGIKIFSGAGTKSSDELERAVEAEVAAAEPVPTEDVSPPAVDPTLEEDYLELLLATWPGELSVRGLRLALDCAHGATHRVGPRLAERLGVDLVTMGTAPDGRNINRDCGSTHMDPLVGLVREAGRDLGAALDGDGDRCLLVDETGRIVDGDAILLLAARRFKATGELAGDGVVATVMSNMALEAELAREGVRLYRTPVGDKHVAAEMARRGLVLGGEQSGHIIFARYGPTGDGLLTLLRVLAVLAAEGRPLSELGRLEPYPQVLRNLRVRAKPPLEEIADLARVRSEVERRLDGRGRVLLRYSGTEPLLRVMVEAPDEAEANELAGRLVEAARVAIEAETP